MLVTVVIAVLLTAAVPRLQQTAQRMRAEQAAFEMAQLLRAAHEQAVVCGYETVWVWEGESRRARIESASGSSDGTAGVINSAPLPAGLTLSLSRDGAPVECQCVRFFPEGTSESSTLTVTLHEEAFTATVDEATGQVRVNRL